MRIKAVMSARDGATEGDTVVHWGIAFSVQGDGSLVADIDDDVAKAMIDAERCEPVKGRPPKADKAGESSD